MPEGQNHSNFALNTRLSAPRYDTWCKIQVTYYPSWGTLNIGASPQLEFWNNGTMEQWVSGKWGNGILAIFLLKI